MKLIPDVSKLTALVEFKQDQSGYAFVEVTPVIDVNCTGVSWDHILYDFLISCQMDTSSGKPYEDGERRALSYGWKYSFHTVHEVDTEKARNMLRVLEHLDRSMHKMYEEYGSSDTFGTYLLRVLKVMGIKSMQVNVPGGVPHCYGLKNFGGAKAMIDGIIQFKTQEWDKHPWEQVRY